MSNARRSQQEKIKICHIITKLELGGAQQVTLDTLRLLEPECYEKNLITNSEGLLVPDAERIPGLTIFLVPELVREINPAKDFIALLKIKRILRKIGPDIVHTHSSKAGVLGRLAARSLKIPNIIHTYHGFSFHDFQSPAKRALYIFIERIAARKSTHLFAVSKANIEKGIKTKIFEAEACSLTRDAIHTDLFKNQKPDREGVKRGET